MGDAAGEEATALRITATDGDGASTQASMPPVEEKQRRRPAPPPAAGVDATAAEQRCREEEEEADDEQVERFYTLLANIRALRGLYSAGDGGGVSGTAGDGGRGRKRSREAEAPWRPAFRMEDFEEEVSHVAKQGTSGAGDVARPSSSAAAMAGAADGAVREGNQVAEARGRKLGRRVAARG